MSESTASTHGRTRPKLALDFDLRHPAHLGANGSDTYAAAVDIIVDGPAGLVALLTRVADEIGEPVGG